MFCKFFSSCDRHMEKAALCITYLWWWNQLRIPYAYLFNWWDLLLRVMNFNYHCTRYIKVFLKVHDDMSEILVLRFKKIMKMLEHFFKKINWFKKYLPLGDFFITESDNYNGVVEWYVAKRRVIYMETMQISGRLPTKFGEDADDFKTQVALANVAWCELQMYKR